MGTVIKGISGAPGIRMGRAVPVRKTELSALEFPPVQEMQIELVRLREAVEAYCIQTEAQALELEKYSGAEEAAILRGHSQLICDPYVRREIEDKIAGQLSAAQAVTQVFDGYIAVFAKAGDTAIGLRAADVEDVKQGMVRLLLNLSEGDFPAVESGDILVGDELLPSQLINAAAKGVQGVVLTGGGELSHCAILARSLNIPLVVGAVGIWEALSPGQLLVVDGSQGQAIVCPNEEEVRVYEQRLKSMTQNQQRLMDYVNRETRTADGRKLSLTANVCNVDEVSKTLEYGGEGIGLFRSEFLLFGRDTPPDEEEQFEIYRKLSKQMEGRPVTIRIIDAGGDKDIPCLHLPKEENPALGCRGIRFCLQERTFFSDQLRAVLRAGCYGKLSLLLPMVTMVREVRKIKEIIEEAKNDLRLRGEPFDEHLRVGVMIETPAAAVMADRLATEVDFLSIGTNDLTQYLLSADRGNEKVSDLYSYYAPAVIRMLSYVARCVQGEGVPLALCGEAASDFAFLPVLVALGLDELSVRPAVIPATRRALSLWTKAEAEELFRRALHMETEQEVRNLLKENQR